MGFLLCMRRRGRGWTIWAMGTDVKVGSETSGYPDSKMSKNLEGNADTLIKRAKEEDGYLLVHCLMKVELSIFHTIMASLIPLCFEVGFALRLTSTRRSFNDLALDSMRHETCNPATTTPHCSLQ